VENFRKAKLAAALTLAELPSTSKILPLNVFPEDIWRKIVDMGLVVVKEKKKTTKSSMKKMKTKSSKKRKADTKSETESDEKMEVKVKVTISGKQPTLDADCDGRDVKVKIIVEEMQAPLTALVDRHFFSQESEQPTKKRRSSRRRSS